MKTNKTLNKLLTCVKIWLIIIFALPVTAVTIGISVKISTLILSSLGIVN